MQETIQELYGYELEIKLPNDLLFHKKKICGILTQCASQEEKIQYLLISIGFNVNEEKFPEEIENIATSLKKEYNKEFKREGVDIYSKVDITFPQAALGDTINVNTLDGIQQLVIPAGVQQDRVLQIKGAGVPIIGNASKRGNHNFIVKIKTPQNLSAEEKQLYNKLFEINCNKKPSSNFIDKMKNVLHN